MSVFTPAEIAFLEAHRVGRLATAGASGELHVVPVAYRYNPATDTIDIGGAFIGTSKKYRDAGRTGRAAFVVDDRIEGGQAPWHVRGVEVRGRAEAHATGGQAFRPDGDPEFIRIQPGYVVSWGIDADALHPQGRRVG